MTSQTPSRAQLGQPRPKIIAAQTSTPRVETSGSPATRKGRVAVGSFTRMTHTPMETRMNAKSVPMLVMSPTMSPGTNAAKRPTKPKKSRFDL